MSKASQALLWIAALCLIVGGGVAGYFWLAPKLRPDNLMPADTTASSSGGTQPPSTTAPPSTASDTTQADTSGGNGGLTPAYDFAMLDGDGNEVELSSLFGKPLVLNFWASWCGPCKNEMPTFQNVYEELGDEVTFVMVDMVGMSGETEKDGRKLVADEGFTFPVYFDIKNGAAIAYGVNSIPMTLFIDSGGYMVAYASGTLDEDTLREGISMIMD